ncbi:glycosyltransferase family 39 protein [Candidatus Gottesmanbacteria bacterium]|nr:glycosyltransferase family 39 protein [Candidatus Gottesmanbacteria bacterium]MBI5452698.1 glycosyltransferase family 39 protein [Candidatus Gottesmanbacteria bacterium]
MVKRLGKIRRLNWLFILLLFVVLPFRLYHLTYPLLDAHFFRQTQTATIALNFYNHGINLLQTELDIFGIGKEKYITLEFPLYEAIVAVFYKIFFESSIWGRVVSILASFLGAWYLFKLVVLLVRNEKIAFFSSFFFLFAPLNMFYQRSFMIEPLVITLLLSGIFYFCHFVNFNDKKSYLLSVVLLTLGFIHKGIYGPFWLLPITVYYLKKRSFREIFSAKFILALIVPLAVLFFWQKHVDYINTVNGHEYFTSYNKGHMEWNFGSAMDRLSFALWGSYLQQLLNGIFLKPGLVIFLIGLAFIPKIKNSSFFLSGLISQIIYFIVFFKIQSHNYYQAVMIPVFSVFMSIGFVKVSELVKNNHFGSYLKISFMSVFCALFIYKSWINTLPSFYIDWDWYNRLKAVGSSVSDKSVGILATPGFDWNSVYTYIPRHKMLLVQAENVTYENIIKWKKLGYSFMVLHEYEKYPDYFAVVAPGFSLDFLKADKLVLDIPEFKVYQF